jgi:hypothetical protein
MNSTTTVPPTAPTTPCESRSTQYDAFHAARARTDLVARLYATAMEEDHPAEVAASSSCDWPLLGLMTARLRMWPGQLLVDAGCGTGLWLARALALRLQAFDLSSVAVAQAASRRPRFGLSRTGRLPRRRTGGHGPARRKRPRDRMRGRPRWRRPGRGLA